MPVPCAPLPLPPSLAYSLTSPVENPIWLLLIVFALGAAGVWTAGTYLSRWADVIADRTGLGRAFVGVLLLAGATSLPELATTVTASAVGNAALAGNNLLGGLAMQLVVLAVVDVAFVRQGALTFFTPKPALLMQGLMLVLMCVLASAAVVAGDRFTLAGVGAWSAGLAAAYVLALWVMQRYEGDPRWHPDQTAGEREAGEPPVSEGIRQRQEQSRNVATGKAWLYFGLAALGVLVGGFIVTRTSDALAIKTGISSSMVGATLVALTTSLPEVSTTIAAVRLRAYAMAVANILGTNAIGVALLFVSDIFYREGSIMNALGREAAFLALLGAVLTCVYLWGLLERRDRTILRMGYDSAAVLVLYLGGLVIFYFINGQ